MQNEDILKLSELILNEEEECFVPVKKLIKIICDEKPDFDFKEPEMIELLKSDSRFKVFEFPESEEYWDEEEDDIMEQAGFYRGARVVLTEKNIDPDELTKMLEDKAGAALEALKAAYGAKENLSDEDEQQLLELMIKTKELRNHIKDSDDYN